MKKLVIGSLLILYGLISLGQNKDTSNVIRIDSTSSETLYNRAKIWVNNFYTGKDQIFDKEAGTLAGSGNMMVGFPTGRIDGKVEVSFTFKILVKDGRYKYTFENFAWSDPPLGAFQTRKDADTKHFQENLDYHINTMIESLNKAMATNDNF